MAKGCDIRTDLPLYRIFAEGKMVDEVASVEKYWADDSVAFLLGCSFSFEEALLKVMALAGCLVFPPPWPPLLL